MITVYLISKFFLLISGIKTPTTFLVCSNYVFKLFEPECENLFTTERGFSFYFAFPCYAKLYWFIEKGETTKQSCMYNSGQIIK